MDSTLLSLLAQYESAPQSEGGGIFGCFISLIYLAVIVLIFVGFWKVFEKAGKPGWVGIIPIYNIIVLLEIIGKPWWWVLLLFIPVVNIIIGVMINLELARKFGQSTGFAIGLILLPMVFIPILGFGEAKFNPGA